jgi:hypothetical protein
MKQNPNPFVTYGIIAAISSILFMLILYMGGVKWFVHPVAFLGYVIPIVFAVIAAITKKRQNEGYLNFGEALKGVFLVFVISAIGSSLFSYVMFNFVDIPFREALMQQTAETTRELMEKFGAPEEEIDKAIEQSFSGNPYSLGKIFLGFAIACIIWFIIALIVAAIVKRTKPEFPESSL